MGAVGRFGGVGGIVECRVWVEWFFFGGLGRLGEVGRLGGVGSLGAVGRLGAVGSWVEW